MTAGPDSRSPRSPTADASRIALGLAASFLIACGDGADPPVDHYAISEPGVSMSFGHSALASAYLKSIAVDLQWPRVIYTEYAADDLEEPSEFWFTNIDEAMKSDGKALLTEELVAVYESDGVPTGGQITPHCRISIILPPSLHNDYAIRLSAEATKNEGKALVTEELVAKYQADSVPSGEQQNTSPHCRILISLPPTLGNNYAIGLGEDGTYSPETQALLDYLFGVYDQYAPDP